MKSILFSLLFALQMAPLQSGATDVGEFDRPGREEQIQALQPKLQEGCEVLRQNVLRWWVRMEIEEKIRCLAETQIPDGVLAKIMDGFMQDCLASLTAQVRTQLDGRHSFYMSLRPQELQVLFQRHYEPAFRRYCADLNPQLRLPRAADEI